VQYQLNDIVISKTILLRQQHKIKTPDAIIAATALIHNLTLVSRNTVDFKSISGLKVINPYEV
jgi:predicted nucleic acid-binding protein